MFLNREERRGEKRREGRGGEGSCVWARRTIVQRAVLCRSERLRQALLAGLWVETGQGGTKRDKTMDQGIQRSRKWVRAM
jgi:hypothetical protein